MSRRSILASTLSATLALSLATSTMAAGGYRIAQPSNGGPLDENLQLLERMSRGINKIADTAGPAIVLVSIYKNVQTMQGGGMIDPFEFFFGPGFGGPRRGQPQQPQQERAPSERRESGLGSGFFFDLERGYIMTNNHVTQGADEIQLKLANGESYEGKIVGRDKNTDVAVVQVKDKNFSRKGLAQLSFADSDKVKVGDFVVALGAPFGLEASLSSGIVSAVGRGNLDITQLGNFIQTDAAINPGNSGGPLINTSGQVIGMNTAIYSRSGAYNGIGFSLPSNLARDVGEKLINDGRIDRGYIGAGLQTVDPEIHRSLDLPKDVSGVLITQVVPDGPAARGGVEPGDVVVKIDNRDIRNNSELVNVVGFKRPGEKANLLLYRDGKQKNLTLTVGKWPNEARGEDSDEDEERPRSDNNTEVPFGMSVAKVTSYLKERYRFEAGQGLVVTKVEDNGPADRGGVRAGDVILQVNQQKISDAEQFKRAAKGQNRILVRIERKGQHFFVPLTNR